MFWLEFELILKLAAFGGGRVDTKEVWMGNGVKDAGRAGVTSHSFRHPSRGVFFCRRSLWSSHSHQREREVLRGIGLSQIQCFFRTD